jgi:hypothetical protein
MRCCGWRTTNAVKMKRIGQCARGQSRAASLAPVGSQLTRCGNIEGLEDGRWKKLQIACCGMSPLVWCPPTVRRANQTSPCRGATTCGERGGRHPKLRCSRCPSRSIISTKTSVLFFVSCSPTWSSIKWSSSYTKYSTAHCPGKCPDLLQFVMVPLHFNPCGPGHRAQDLQSK